MQEFKEDLRTFSLPFLKELQAEAYPLQICKSRLKNTISELCYQHQLDFIQHMNQTQKTPQTPIIQPDYMNLFRRNIHILPSTLKDESPDKVVQALKYLESLYELYKEIQSPFNLLANSPIFGKLFPSSLSELSKIIMQEFLDRSNNEDIITQSQETRVLNQIFKIMDKLLAMQEQAEQIITQSKIFNENLGEIYKIYSNFLENLMEATKTYQKDDSQNLQFMNTLLEKFIYQNKSAQFSSYEIKSPIFNIAKLNDNQALRLLNLEEQLINSLEEQNYKISRIGPEFVYMFQRYHLSYLVKKLIFNLKALPGIVVRLKEIQANLCPLEGQKRFNKRYYYFFISQVPPKKSAVSFYDLKKSDDNEYAEFYDGRIHINPIDYANHFLGALLTQSFDYIITDYSMELNEQNEVEKKDGLYTGNIVSFADHQSSHLRERAIYEELRNPLFYFKGIIFESKLNSQYQKKYLKNENIFTQFLLMQEYLTLTQCIDFSYPLYNQTDKDYFRRKRSLQLNFESTYYPLKKVTELEATIDWLKEIVIPTQGYFTLAQITERMFPVLFKFLELTIISKSMSEFSIFLRTINLEEILAKIVDKKYLNKYTNLNHDIYESITEKRIQEQFQSFDDKDRKLLEEIGLSTSILTNYSILKFFTQSPAMNIIHLMQRIDLKFDVSLSKRALTLEFMAVKAFPLIKHQLSIFSKSAYNIFIDQFNQSWKNNKIWIQTFNASYSQTQQTNATFNKTSQFYIELMGFLFGINVFKILKDETFASLEFIGESNCIIELYLQSHKLRKDLGYPDNKTLVEVALQTKRFNLVLQLVQNGEGVLIHTEYLNHLINTKPLQIYGFQMPSLQSQKIHQNDLETIQKIFAHLDKIHPSIVRHLIWQHIWSLSFQQTDLNDQLYVVSKGNVKFPLDFINELFKTNNQEKLELIGYLKQETQPPTFINRSLKQLIQNDQINQQQLGLVRILQTFSKNEYEYLLFWQQPKFLSYQYMCNSIYNLLKSPNYRPYQELCFFRGQYFLVQEMFQYGQTLQQFLHHFGELGFTKSITPYQLSNRIILNILLLQSLVSPNQEIMVPHPKNHGLFMLINMNTFQDQNQDLLVNAAGFQSLDGSNNEIKLQCKSILFLMEYMNKPLPIETIKKFQEINLVQLVFQWVKSLQSHNSKMQKQGDYEGNQNLHAFDIKSFQGIAFKKEAIINLIRRAHIINKIIKDISKDSQITHMQILSRVDQQLATFYETIQKKTHLNLLQKFQYIQSLDQLKEVNEKFLMQKLASYEENFSQKKYLITGNDIALKEKSFKGPTELLKILEKYSSLLMKNPKDMNNILKKLHQISKNEQLYFLLSNLDFESLGEVQQIQLVKEIGEYSSHYKNQCSYICIQNASFVNFSHLNLIQLDRIITLNIQGLVLLTDYDLTQLASKCQNLNYLNITECRQITQISSKAEQGFLKQAISLQQLNNNPLIFPSLKTLIADKLVGLKEVEIQGSHIQNLSFNECSQLSQIFQVESPKLQKIRIEKCKALKDEIVMMWLISGKQILFDESTSGGAFNYLLKEKDSDKSKQTRSLSTQEFLESRFNDSKLTLSQQEEYELSVYEIFGKLIQKQWQSDALNIVVIWLFKRGLLNQDINKQLTGISGKKLNQKSKELILVSLCKLFFQNTHLHQLNLKELSYQWQNDDNNEYNLLSIFIDSMVQAVKEIIEESKKMVLHDGLQKLKSFFDNLDVISFSWLKDQNFTSIGLLFKLLSPQLNQQKKQLQLDFSQNHYLPFDGLKEFLMILENTKKIQISKLDLSQNQLTHLHIDILHTHFDTTQFVGNSVFQILQLSFKNSGFDDQLILELSKWIWKAKFLRLLDLSENQFTWKSMNQLLQQGISESNIQTDLTTLILNWNNLDKVQFQLLNDIQEKSSDGSTIIKQNSFNSVIKSKTENKGFHLTQLSLQRSFKENCNIIFLAEYLANENCSLTYLDISQNQFSASQCSQFAQAIQKNQSIRQISIQRMIIEEQGFSLICEGIQQHQFIEEINISIGLSLTENNFETLCKLIANSTSVRKIQVSSFEVNELHPKVQFFKLLSEAIEQNDTILDIKIQNLDQIFDLMSKSEQIIAKNYFTNLEQKLSLNKEKIILTQKSTREIPKTDIDFIKEKDQKQDKQRIEYRLDGFKFGSTVDFYRLGLSIDGGGTRGLIPATMINYISEQIQREPYEIFDSIGGSSIGGIIALGIAGTLNGIEPIIDHNEIVELFRKYSTTIFDRPAFLGNMLNFIDKAKYEPAGIESVLQKYFSVCRLSDVMPGTNISVTAVRLEKKYGKNISKVFRSREAIKDDRKNFLLRDIGRATTAAPTYFPAADIRSVSGKNYVLVDGGVGLNNPAKLILDEIQQQALTDGNPDNYHLLSLSTGMAQRTSNLKNSAGFLQAGSIIQVLGYGAQDYVDRDLEQNYFGRCLRLIPDIPIQDFKAGLDNTDPQVLEVYEQCSREYAEEKLFKQHRFGKFKDRSFLEWIAENTDRKKDII